MKKYHESIDVAPDRGQPARFRWRGRIYHVRQILDFWVYRGRWWSTEEKRAYLRVGTDGGVFEIYRLNGHWLLSRVLD